MRKRTDFFGNLGDIWAYNDTLYKAVVFKRNGDERIYSFNPKDLQKWLKRLEVPASSTKERNFRDNFPSTLEQIAERYQSSEMAKKSKTKYLKVKDI